MIRPRAALVCVDYTYFENGGFLVCRPVIVYWLNCVTETTKVTEGRHMLEFPNVFSVDPLGSATVS
jgi:hypothetical protein